MLQVGVLTRNSRSGNSEGAGVVQCLIVVASVKRRTPALPACVVWSRSSPSFSPDAC